jgi:putative hemolysin
MKIKILCLLLLGLSIGVYASCTKDEMIKFLDKGYSKAELDKICKTSPKKIKKIKKKLQWINPKASVCTKNGGTLKRVNKKTDKVKIEACASDYNTAKEICTAMKGRLASINEFKKVLSDCGATLDKPFKNAKNRKYQACYKNKGFIVANYSYFSSTNLKSNPLYSWRVFFASARTSKGHIKDKGAYVRCIKK